MFYIRLENKEVVSITPLLFFIFQNDEQDSMKQSFQDGVDTLYNTCVSCGVTPSNKTPTAISNAIQSIYNSGNSINNAEVNVPTFTMSNTPGITTLNLSGFNDVPNYVSISAVNNVWMDMIYDARYSTSQVKYCTYSTSQTIAYENRSARMPTFTKDKITVSSFVSGVGNKKATAIVARFTKYNG